MIRKMLLIASAVAIPLGATAVTAVAGTSSAGAVTPLAISCTLGNPVVSFAAPGLSQNGSFTTAPTSTTTTSAQTLKCGGAGNGTGPGQSIVSNNTACTATNVPVTGCTAPPPQMYNYDSVAGFSGTATTLWMQVPVINATINGTNYSSSSKSSAGIVCAGGELGFKIKGKLTAPAAHAGEATKVLVCLGSDTGPGTTGSFTNDFNQPGRTIATATMANDSKLKIS